MNKEQSEAARFSTRSKRSVFELEKKANCEGNISERWNLDIADARRTVAAQIIQSVKSKWGTAVALEAATSISQTEISRIRRGKLTRFSLDRLVRLLWIVDPEVGVELRVRIAAKGQPRLVREKGMERTS